MKFKNMNIIKFFTIVLIILVSPSLRAEPKPKYSASGNILQWKKSELNICINDSAKNVKNINLYFKMAIDTWKSSVFFPKLKINDYNCDIFVDYKEFDGPGAVRALATNTLTYYETGEIIKSNIIINKFYEKVVGDASNNSEIYDMPGTLAHELGHAVGLEEDYVDKYSVMFDINFIGRTYKREAKFGDLTAIYKIYGRKL